MGILASDFSGLAYLPVFVAAVLVLSLLTAGAACAVRRKAWPLLLTPLLVIVWGAVGLLVIRLLSAAGIKP